MTQTVLRSAATSSSAPLRLPYQKLLLMMAAAGLLGLAAYLALRPPAIAYETSAIARGDIEASVTAIGTLQPRRYVDVGVQVSGQVLRLHVQPGDLVERGQLLVEIDPSVPKATVDAGRAALLGLRAQLAEQQALKRLAAHQHERQQRMAADNATREEDVQRAEAAVATADARIEALRAQLAQTQATLQADETRLGYTRIYAPMAGTVVSVHAREGQTLNATYQTPDILRIADLSTMTVWTDVSEADVRRVRVGQALWFVTLGGDAQLRRWHSRVRQVLPAPAVFEKKSESSGGQNSSAPGKQAVTYTVLFDVDNADGELMTQMTAQVSFVLAQASQVLLAPLAAVGGDARVRVLRPDGTPETRQLRLGVSNRNQVEVIEGLAEGEALIVAETPAGSTRPWWTW
jgi:membrane fusion protein, macrolide-specific efflux system